MNEQNGAQPAKPRPPSSGAHEAFLAIFLLTFTVAVVALCCGLNGGGTGGGARGPSPCEKLLAKTADDLARQLRGMDDYKFRLENPDVFPRVGSGWARSAEQQAADRERSLVEVGRARPVLQSVADKVAAGRYREAWTDYEEVEQQWLISTDVPKKEDVSYELYKLKEDCE